MAVNDVELTYDEVGNVLTYGDKEFTWNSGRNLESIVDGDNNYSYTYDENGIRTSKTVNGVTTYYNTKDGVILSQSDGTNTMYFQYDTNGTPLGFIYNGTQYFYMTNQMGDIIAITESDGNIIAQYVYDEWGKLLNVYTINEDNVEQSKVANANPLRYRGYYYDTETGYYYLQSRYYDASICRFINADIPEIAQMLKGVPAGTNLFVYCNNNPVNNSDPSGTVISYAIRQAIFGAILGLITQLLCDIISYKFKLSKTKWSGVGTYVTTILSSAVDAVVKKGVFKAVLAAAGKNMVEQVLNRIFHKTPIDFNQLLKACLNGLVNHIISKYLKIKSPKFIRDIKQEAQKQGIKGTVKLTAYLQNKIYKINLANISIGKLKTILQTTIKGMYYKIKAA